MKQITLFFLLATSTHLFGQQMGSSLEDQIDFFAKEWYEKYMNLFEEKDFLSDRQKDYEFPWSMRNHSKKEVEDYARLLMGNASVTIEKKLSKEVLVLSFSYPDDERSNMLIKHLEFPELIVNENEAIRSNDLNWSTAQQCEQEGTKTCAIVEASFHDVSELINEDRIAFNLKILHKYSYQKIGRDDINSSLTINEFNLNIIDIIDNKIIVAHEKDWKNQDMHNLGYINIDHEGHLIKQLNYQEFLELQRKYGANKVMGVNASTRIEAYNYKIFKENTNLSYSGFRKLIDKKLRKVLNATDKDMAFENEFGPLYTVFSSPSKIEDFYFYQPTYIHKKFELRLR